jgi:hypothetical protein
VKPTQPERPLEVPEDDWSEAVRWEATVPMLVAVDVKSRSIERLEKFPHSNREAGYSRYEKRQAQLPLCYTLVSRKSKLADALISHRD